jgi:hypothetical protein
MDHIDNVGIFFFFFIFLGQILQEKERKRESISNVIRLFPFFHMSLSYL